MTPALAAKDLAAPATGVPGPAAGQILVLGRALHEPWNEGSRVINRNFARAAAQRRQVQVVSLTQHTFRCPSEQAEPSQAIDHVYMSGGYSLAEVYAGLPRLIGHLEATYPGLPFAAAHVFGLPLSIAVWLRLRGVPVIAHVMAIPLRAQDQLLTRMSTRLFQRCVDAYAVTSEALLGLVAGRGVPPEKLVVVPPAVDTDLFQPGDQAQARRQLGLDAHEAVVLYVGRLSRNRFPARSVREGLERAAGQLRRPVRLVALAPGETFDGSENTASYLRRCTEEVERELRAIAGVRVDIRPGNLADPEKILWLQAADVVLAPFAAPESVEPPLTLLEAMACGAVVVVTPAANRSLLVDTGKTGVMYENPTQLATALLELLQGPDRARCLARAARERVTARHSLAAVSESAAGLWATVGRPPTRRGRH